MEKINLFKELVVTINRTFRNKTKILPDTDTPADKSVYQMSIEKAQTDRDENHNLILNEPARI